MQLLENGLGYTRQHGPEVDRDYRDPLYEPQLQEALLRINRGLPQEAVDEALQKVRDLGSGSLIQKNRLFTDYLQTGVEVSFYDGSEQRAARVKLVDYDTPDNNSFVAANQWRVEGAATKRPDIVLFVNGLPLVVIELKSPTRDETDASAAYRQLRNYIHDIPDLFHYNAILVMSDLETSKAGTITSGEDRFMEWKTADGRTVEQGAAAFETFFTGMFEKARLLDILQNFICFDVDGPSARKILAAYHQYYAVRKAVESTVSATDGRGGVFWHTQGSGKSLSMVFYGHALQAAMDSPTIVVITDRNDLDNQLYGQFARTAEFLRQVPVQAESRKHLKELLKDRQANGIFFTTMQKFEEDDEPLSERSNIVVIADEAHRSQYGLNERIVARRDEDGSIEAHAVVGTARIIRNSLPNATYIGFTGTPISEKDRDTQAVFGDYISIYDMTQAVADGATRPIYYESRVLKLQLDPETLEAIDAEYERLGQYADEAVIEKSKQSLASLEGILGADTAIDSLVADIVEHYERDRANLLTGKAMIVAYSREIALKIYDRILRLRPEWKEKVAVVMTQGNNDPEEWRKVIGNKAHKDELARKFKDNDSELKIAIVVDMWLTGFDVPSLATMYVYKPMAGHNLMQAIARVNRVFEDKEGGLIVDYVGIAKALRAAMRQYTKRDQDNFENMDIARTALPKFEEELSVCRDLLHGFDYSVVRQGIKGNELEVSKLIGDAVDYLLEKNRREHAQNKSDQVTEIYLSRAMALHQALTLCSSLLDESDRAEAAFLEAVRVTLGRLLRGSGKLSLPAVNERISSLLQQSIKSDGVAQLTTDAEFSLFDESFLQEVASMGQKNLAAELLRKLLNDQISAYKGRNLVKSIRFSERMQQIMNRYINGLITNEEVISELLALAVELKQARKEGQDLGLTEEEMAFYDALSKPQAVKDFYENAELVAMTKELTETLRKSRTIDWQRKESARADMRRKVRRLLKKYRYPPEEAAEALETVIAQCEMWVDAAAGSDHRQEGQGIREAICSR